MSGKINIKLLVVLISCYLIACANYNVPAYEQTSQNGISAYGEVNKGYAISSDK